MTEIIDSLELIAGKRLSVLTDGGRLSAVPMTRDGDGTWRRAHPGDGVAQALLNMLAHVPSSRDNGQFTVHSWVRHTTAGERTVGVDQTNESVIVGDAAVVKWATHLQVGPHPAPRRISVLRANGFNGMPTPWGLITWQPAGSAGTLVASVDEYLPDAVDGWTWAVDLITAAAIKSDPTPWGTAAAEVGNTVAGLHAALAGTAVIATTLDAARWRDDAVEALETVCALDDSAAVLCARARRSELSSVLEELATLAGTRTIEGHGDLHVGQILHSRGRFVVTDFDGNPVLPAPQRMLPIPAALDIAGMTQSLAHVAIVARKYTRLDPTTLAAMDHAGRTAFIDSYTRRLAELGHGDLYDAGPLRAFRVQQVLREIIYAAQHLPRWMYVPDAALGALLDERNGS